MREWESFVCGVGAGKACGLAGKTHHGDGPAVWICEMFTDSRETTRELISFHAPDRRLERRLGEVTIGRHSSPGRRIAFTPWIHRTCLPAPATAASREVQPLASRRPTGIAVRRTAHPRRPPRRPPLCTPRRSFRSGRRSDLVERIPVQGIDGTLLLTGSSTPSPESLATFVRQAGKRSARIVCVEVVGDSPASPPRSSSDVPGDWRRRGWNTGRHSGSSPALAGWAPDRISPRCLQERPACGSESRHPVLLAQWLASDPVAVACRALRGVVLGGSASFATSSPSSRRSRNRARTTRYLLPAAGVLPGVALSTGRDDDTRLAAVLARPSASRRLEAARGCGPAGASAGDPCSGAGEHRCRRGGPGST